MRAVVAGIAVLWLCAPTYDQLDHPAGELMALALGLALIGGGLYRRSYK